MNEVFAIRLKQLRKENNKTQDEIAKLLGITRANLSGYERNLTMPPFDKIKILANYFNVSVDYLVGSTNERGEATKQETNDIGASLGSLVEQLQNKYVDISLDGITLDDTSRQLLVASLQSTINLSKLLKKGTDDK